MAGHIQLGAPGALRDYNLEPRGEGLAWDSGPAFPFAAKVNSTNQYDELDAWNEWTQEDWQQGVGRIDPQAGGFLYAEAETRVPGQIILPPLLQQCDKRTINGTSADARFMPSAIDGMITVGNGGYPKVAMSYVTPNPHTITDAMVYFYCRIPAGVDVKITRYTNSGGSPDTGFTSLTVTGLAPDKNFAWYGGWHSTGASAATRYWYVLEPVDTNDSFEVAYASTGYDTLAQRYNGSNWANITGTYLLFAANIYRLGLFSFDAAFARFNGNLYYHTGSDLYKYDDSGSEQFDAVGTITGTDYVTSMVVFGPKIYFGRASGNYTTMSTSEVFSAAGVSRKLFLEFKGFLYSTWQNDLYYSVDGSTWTGPFGVGGDDCEIRGLAGMGDSVYLATDKALFRFAPGDVVEEVTRFGSENSDNGWGMLEYNGRLYIPCAGRLFCLEPSGQLQDIWINRGNDLPIARYGNIRSLARMNNWLVAIIVPNSPYEIATVWAWQEEGWHFLARLPSHSGLPDYAPLIYDRESSRLWIGTDRAGPYFLAINDYTLNPFNDSSYSYQPFGWIEQDRFYGGQYLLNKDLESVRIIGENLSANQSVAIYWQDEDSATWELLGTATDEDEIRWEAPYTTRPSGKWIRLGLLLQTDDGDETPRIRAVVVKFIPKSVTKIQDSLNLVLEGNMQGPDGAPGAYTTAQQWAHIKSLIDSVKPIIYRNPEGTYYECQVIDWSQLAATYSWENNAALIKEKRVRLVVRQVNDAVYTPPP